MKRKQWIAGLLSLSMIAGLMPGTAAVSAREKATTVLACSDFQAETGNEEGQGIVSSILEAMAEDGITKVDGFLCAGDYDYDTTENAVSTKEGVDALLEVIDDVVDDEIVLVQGNHDTMDGISPSGNNDPASGDYGVFVLNEDDYMWFNDDEARIKRTTANLLEYLNEKIEERYNKPIFVVSHLPLHYNMRTKKDGDGMHANYIFNVLNAAADKGLNLIFLYGHNHSNGWDDYLGGAAIYLEKGDNILIAQNSKTRFKEETLNFTYMNAGYVGYYRHVNESDDTLTMTYFEILEDRVIISRYSKDGRYLLKSFGETNAYRDETGYEPDMSVCYSERPMYLSEVLDAEPIDESIIEETNEGVAKYQIVNSVDELKDGGKYIVVNNYGDTDHIMTLEEVSKPNEYERFRTGFLAESTTAFTGTLVEGNFGDKEWTFTESGDGWLLGDGNSSYIKFTDTEETGIAATLETEGTVFDIEKTAEGFEFVSGDWTLDFNQFRGLINGYSKDLTLKNGFYIYERIDEAAAAAANETAAPEVPEAASEVMTADAASASNIALNKQVAVSDETGLTDADYSKENAVDGDTSTRWCSQDIKDNQGVLAKDTGDAWIMVDFGIKSEVQELKISFFNQKYPTVWKVQASDTAAEDSWEDIAVPAACSTANPVVTISLDEPVDAKYIRFYFEEMNKNAAGHGIDVREIEIKGVEGTPCEECKETMIVREIEGSCTEDGYTGDEVCTVCYRTIVQGEEVIAPGHQWEWIEELAPTCDEEGRMRKACSECDIEREGSIYALKHNWGKWKVIKEATQAAHGKRSHDCTVCEASERADFVYRPQRNPFTDIEKGAYYYDPVLWALEESVTSGLTETTFAPGASCTRGQVVTFLWRAMGEPEPKTTANPFGDVAEGKYYYKPVLWAVENNITSGLSANTFGPSETVTRAQFVTFLHRSQGNPAYSASNPFGDVAEGKYYYAPILWAVENKVTTGLSATAFGPSEFCTRGQVVTFLYRALK